MPPQLLAGAAEVDITPPVGTKMIGGLRPRPSSGIDDPLMVKAIVLESDGVRIAYAIFDLAMLGRDVGDPAVALASRETGIPADHIAWSASHTHSGPCTQAGTYPRSEGNPIDEEWLRTVPRRFADCIRQADANKAPVRMSRLRGYQHGLSGNRRVRFKDGREINTWLLNSGEDDLQCVGAAGPVDPEVGILSFEDPRGRMVAVMFHFALHANAHFGTRFSGDYPAVVAGRIRERFGPQAATLFVPGACGDVNPIVADHRALGNALADVIIRKLEARRPIDGPVFLGACKRTVLLPCRDFAADQEQRLQASQWSQDAQAFFRETQKELQERGDREVESVLQAWHIGDVAFASFPGEPFIELGVAIKRNSPFPWSYPVELGGDYKGYFVTRGAWVAGGYESLVSSVGLVDPAGGELMVRQCLEMLQGLHRGWKDRQ